MRNWLSKPNPAHATALELYGSSVAQARQPAFYRDWGVADTLDGRFELVMLHVAVVLRRLTAQGAAGKELGRHLVERMFAALDDDFRELGIGDLSVPKKMQAAASAFYGRLNAYDGPLGAGDGQALADALARNIPAANGHAVAATRLAAYAAACATELAGQNYTDLERGKVQFPNPAGAAT